MKVSINPQWKKILVITGIVAAVIVLGVGAFALYKPIRANQLADEALKSLTKGEYLSARAKVAAANSLAPRSGAVARAMAKVWTAISPTEVVPLWENSLEISGGSAEDRRGLATALIAAGELDSAKTQINMLMAKDPNNPANRFVEIIWLGSTDRVAEALEKLSMLVVQVTDSPEYWATYNSLAMRGSPAAQKEFLAAIKPLFKNKGDLGLWALRVNVFWAKPDEVPARCEALLAHPLATRDTKLWTLMIQRFQQKLSVEEVRAAATRLFNLAQLEDRRSLAEFLKSVGDFQGVLDLVDAKFAVSSKEFLLLHLDALAGMGKWQAVVEVLEVKSLPMEEYWREIFRARSLSNLKREDESALAWRRALTAAGNDPIALSDIAGYVMALGAVTQAEEVLPRLVDNAPARSRMNYYTMWAALEAKTGDLTRLLPVLERMSKEFPKNASITNDLIYYSILAGREGDWVLRAYNLAKESPSVLAHRITLGLALLKSNQPAKALEVVESTRLSDWSVVRPGWQYVRAAILKANGQEVPDLSKVVMQAMPAEQALVK